MTYQETLDWMFSQLPMYQRQGQVAYKKDLTNILAFAKVLGNPHQKFHAIHVGGTNGKGSTSHMIASILQESKLKVGLYTSPHLKNFTERVKINGVEIERVYVTEFIEKYKDFLEKQGLSFFEMTVGLAFDYFAEQQVDIAIIEVGLGGRLDSTNIITPEVSVITNIGFDHMQFLGETLPEIAYEKAGIIKKNIPVVVGERQDETTPVFEKKAHQMGSKLLFASDEFEDYRTDLLGVYQKKNANTAVKAIQCLSKLTISDKEIYRGLKKVVQNTAFHGRWQVLRKVPKTICDTAHNKEGLTYVVRQLKEEIYQKLHIVLGMVSDKNVENVLSFFPSEARYYFCCPGIPRGLDQQKLKAYGFEFGLIGEAYESVLEAYKHALLNASNQDLIFIGGSTFVVAEVL
ncbi:MAG: bifunctional folylpolyglutamate synthase/dihydrofolate synthase [Flavobacteriaceae bacterium]|nr:bifunctional folylpolyglutamate synthase/dihydrofolate synthase [Flavobacteriaceae bacterium]